MRLLHINVIVELRKLKTDVGLIISELISPKFENQTPTSRRIFKSQNNMVQVIHPYY